MVDHEQARDHDRRQSNGYADDHHHAPNVKPSTRRERPRSPAKNELPAGPNRFWITIVALLNILILAGFGYMIWDMAWDFDSA